MSRYSYEKNLVRTKVYVPAPLQGHSRMACVHLERLRSVVVKEKKCPESDEDKAQRVVRRRSVQEVV